ncbi:MAG: glycosyltransferase [Agriterribacter sp.]
MQKPTVLVAPLDWGLGHAARCIPIINELIRQDWEVWLAGSGATLTLLQKQYPQLPCLTLKPYNVFYHAATGRLPLTVARQAPAIWASIRHEHRWLQQVLKTRSFDVILSDNRYGLHSNNTYCVFITHQLAIRSGLLKWVDGILRKFNYHYINKFNECWVPDWEGAVNIAGELSHPFRVPANMHYIGPLSRFEPQQQVKQYDIAIVLSGPEPCRTDWEQKLQQELMRFEGSALLVRGIPGGKALSLPSNIVVKNLLAGQELNAAVEQAEWIICRSGYSSVMDLIALKKKAILVPTPGQPEQEYLADYLCKQGIFYSVRESEFSLKDSLQKAATFPFDFSKFGEQKASYRERITELTERVRKGVRYKE